MTNNEASSKEKPSPESAQLSPQNGIIDSRALLQGREAITIIHYGETYRLRETKQGKLILTK